MEDLSTIASIADAALSFALLAGLVLMFIKGTLVPKAVHERTITEYKSRLEEKDAQCELRMKERDGFCSALERVHTSQVSIVQQEGQQRVDSLTEIMREREKRYAAVIASLEASANLESDIATILHTFKMGGMASDD